MNAFVSPSRSPRGFTLIELLTVIAIVGILAAIIIPVVGKVRQTARAAQCQSNMRQIGLAYRLFAEDYKGIVVDPYGGGPITASGHWGVALFPYIGSMTGQSEGYINAIKTAPNTLRPPSVFGCPATTRLVPSLSGMSDYALNATLTAYDRPGVKRPINLSKIASPSQTYLAIDSNGWRDFTYSDLNGPFTGSAKTRHDQRMNMLFVDGSVRSIRFDAIKFYGRGGTRDQAPWGPL
jgi:prepilin-type N-terminal cleavage/methylation domain